MKKNIIGAVLIVTISIVVAFTILVSKNQESKAQIFDSEKAAQLFNNSIPGEATYTNGEIVEFPLVASPAQLTLPSGIAQNVWAYNGQIPGPEIRIGLGDTLKILFTNNLPDETTIHFHGIRLENEMDGVPHVTQEPIQPGDNFVYEFTPKDAGTFWFHPHVRGSEQVERGLYGTIVVEDNYTSMLEHDNVVVLDDWRIDSSGNVAGPFNHPHDISHDGRWGNVVTANSTSTQEYTIKSGERIRLRLVNASNARIYAISANQNVDMVAFDGMSLSEPQLLEKETIAPGNRIDLEWTGQENQELVISDSYDYKKNLIRIKVEGSAETVSLNYPDSIRVPDWIKDEFIQAEPDYSYDLSGLGGMMMSLEWAINNRLYGEDTPFSFDKNRAVKIRLNNSSGQPHPMHFHGQFFAVISTNGVPEPYFRWQDTVLVLPQESVDIIMLPQDSGSWAMHCHILEHAEAGMMTTFQVKD